MLGQPSALARTFKCSGIQSARACALANKVLWHAEVCSGNHSVLCQDAEDQSQEYYLFQNHIKCVRSLVILIMK